MRHICGYMARETELIEGTEIEAIQIWYRCKISAFVPRFLKVKFCLTPKARVKYRVVRTFFSRQISANWSKSHLAFNGKEKFAPLGEEFSHAERNRRINWRAFKFRLLIHL